MRYAVEIKRRPIAAAYQERFTGEAHWQVKCRYYRWRWQARLVVWAVNTFGAGPAYDHARLLGETL